MKNEHLKVPCFFVQFVYLFSKVPDIHHKVDLD